MRILIVSHFFPPLNAVASLRPYSWAKYWSKMGHEVVVLTSAKPPGDAPLQCPMEGFEVVEVPSIYMPLHALIKGRVGKDVSRKRMATSRKEGFISRVLGFFQHRYGIFWTTRMPDHMDFWIWPAVRAAKRMGKFDLVVSSFGPYAAHVVAYFIKRSQGCKWIADYRDLWTDSYVYPGLWPFTVIEKSLERMLLRSVDILTTVSMPLAGVLERKYGKKAQVIENGFDTEDLKTLPIDPIFQDDGKVRLVYTGGIYAGKQDLSPLLKAIELLKREHPLLKDRLEIVFAGAIMGNLEELIKEYGVGDCAKVCGLVPRLDALRMQRDANALVFLDWDDPIEAGVLTGKLFEYIFSGSPILSIGGEGDSEACRILQEVGRGICFGEDVGSIKTVLKQLLDGRPLAIEKDVEALSCYTREALARKMLNLAVGASGADSKSQA